MRKLKLILGSLLFSGSVIVGLPFSAKAQQVIDPPTTLSCLTTDTSADESESTCDISVTNQVSVSGGSFVAADTSDATVQAFIGDIVVWHITLSDLSTPNIPTDGVQVSVTIPDNSNVDSSSASTGTFDGGLWSLYSDQLPATLTITSTITRGGAGQSTATMTGVGACVGCDQDAQVLEAYADDNAANDTNSARINVSEKPQGGQAGVLGASTGGTTDTSVATGVLGAETLAATGVNSTATVVIGSFLVLLVALLARKLNKQDS